MIKYQIFSHACACVIHFLTNNYLEIAHLQDISYE